MFPSKIASHGMVTCEKNILMLLFVCERSSHTRVDKVHTCNHIGSNNAYHRRGGGGGGHDQISDIRPPKNQISDITPLKIK